MRERIARTIVPAIAAALMTTGVVGAAGTAANPHVTDPAGDANGVDPTMGSLLEQDTTPASLGSADLRAVWFETSFSTHLNRDSEGRVLRVEHVPTGVRLGIRTELPIHPTPQGRVMLYHVSSQTSSPTLLYRFILRATPGQTSDTARLYTCNITSGQCSAGSPGTVNYDGNVVTLSFTYEDPAIAQWLPLGKQLPLPTALSYTPGMVPPPDDLPRTGYMVNIDGTRASLARSRTFTVGEDLPPEVDCTSDPTYPECES